MAKVVADMSMSLDGYVADENDGIDEVFNWYSTGPKEFTKGAVEFKMTEENAKTFEEGAAAVGAIISGRRTSDLAGAWNGSHPIGCPTYVVSHRLAPDHLDPESSTVYFVDDLGEAVRRAKEASGEKTIGVAGGQVVRQLLDLGLLDEIRVSLTPFVLGEGKPFFPPSDGVVKLEGPEITPGDGVVHLRYRVVR